MSNYLHGHRTPHTHEPGIGSPNPSSMKLTPSLMDKHEAQTLLTQFPIATSVYGDVIAVSAQVTFADASYQTVESLNSMPVLRHGTVLPAGDDGSFSSKPAVQTDFFLTWSKDASGIDTFVVNSTGNARLLRSRALDRVLRHALLKIDKDFPEMLDGAKRSGIYYQTLTNGACVPLAAPHLFTAKKVNQIVVQLRQQLQPERSAYYSDTANATFPSVNEAVFSTGHRPTEAHSSHDSYHDYANASSFGRPADSMSPHKRSAPGNEPASGSKRRRTTKEGGTTTRAAAMIAKDASPEGLLKHYLKTYVEQQFLSDEMSCLVVSTPSAFWDAMCGLKHATNSNSFVVHPIPSKGGESLIVAYFRFQTGKRETTEGK
eukprot:Colp12_sorted_trinity150504_noHs@4272